MHRNRRARRPRATARDGIKPLAWDAGAKYRDAVIPPRQGGLPAEPVLLLVERLIELRTRLLDDSPDHAR